jgi:hypothetical protein
MVVNGLASTGPPVVCVETRHMQALLKGQQISHDARARPHRFHARNPRDN